MTHARPLALVVLALVALPACGHKGPPQPPRRRTPPSLADFRIAQRGDALEVSCTAPAASIDGVPFRRLQVEIFWGEGQVDLEKAGRHRTVDVAPGAPLVERLPLPAPGTVVRAAGRAVAGRNRGQRSLILALEAQAPLTPPRELGAWLREQGVVLNWKGPMPEPVKAPDLGAPPGRDSPGDPASARPGAAAPAGEGEVDPSPPENQEAAEGEKTVGAEGGGRAEEDTSPEGDATADHAPAAEGGEAQAQEAEPPQTHGFRVYRRLEGAPWRGPLNRLPQHRRVFTDTSPPLDRDVCYVVRAVGSVDPLIESAPSNEACVRVSDIVPPGPPSGLAVIPRDGGLEVLWSPSPDPAVASYRIYRAAEGGQPQQVGEVPAGTTTWLDGSAEGGILQRYTVTAVDQAGNEGPPSGAAEGIRR